MNTRKVSDLVTQEAELLDAGLALQSQGLKLLLAEMRALAALMPVADQTGASTAETDEKVEAGFDNMPV